MGAAEATVLPFVPLYLFERGLSAPVIGVVMAVAASASLVAGLVWAYLADHRLRKEGIIIIASATAAGAVLLLPLADGAVALGAAIVLIYVARSPFALLDPIALQRLGPSSRTHYARIRLRMSAGWAVSVVVAGMIFQTEGLRMIPFLYAPLVAVFGLWVWHALIPTIPNQDVQPATPTTAALRPVRVPFAMIGFLVSCALLGVSLASTQTFFVLRISVLGGGALLIGAAAAFQALTEIPTMAYTHLLAKRLGHRVLYAIGCAIYLGVFVAWAFASDAVVVALLRLVCGVGFALTYVAAVLVADDLSPAHLRATSQALVKSVMFGLAPIIGTLGGGLVYGAFGPRVMFVAATAVVGAAALVALIAIPARGSGRVLLQPAPVLLGAGTAEPSGEAYLS